MKILQALKKIKHIDRKIEKALRNTEKWCSYISEHKNEPKPTYDAVDIGKMRQQIRDWAAEKVRIRAALHLTNVRTKVEFDGEEYSIDELLLMQNVTIPTELKALTSLRRKEKSSGFGRHAQNDDSFVVLQYNPKDRDKEIEKLEHRRDLLDELLDNLNIETEVVGLD